MAVRVLSAKLAQELIDELDAAAAARGVSRNRLVRESLEAMLEGRVTELTSHERMTRDFRAGMRRDLEGLRCAPDHR